VSSFVGRLMAFTFLLSLLLAYLWAVGNLQEFQDTTQGMLLAGLRWMLLAELAFGCWLLMLLCVRVAVERKAFLWRWLTALGSMGASLLLLASLQFLQAWLSG
jgi:hypothetical protein